MDRIGEGEGGGCGSHFEGSDVVKVSHSIFECPNVNPHPIMGAGEYKEDSLWENNTTAMAWNNTALYGKEVSTNQGTFSDYRNKKKNSANKRNKWDNLLLSAKSSNLELILQTT